MPRFLERLLARTGRNASRIRQPHLPGHRPRLEALEERSNPVTLNFVPFSVVAANPAALPATALMQFNPLPEFGILPPAPDSFHSPVQIRGSFQQSLIPSAATGTNVSPAGHLNVTFSLVGSVNGTVTPPGPTATQPGALSATFSLSGQATETLYLPGPSPQVAWEITGTITEQGSVSGPLLSPLAGATAVDIMNFNATIGLKQSEVLIAPLTANVGIPWSVQATIQSSGKFQVGAVPPPVSPIPISLAVPFSLQDQITESLTHVSPTANVPPPPIRISAVDNATGKVTVDSFPPSSPIVPPTVFGTTQYQEQLSETITYPPSPTNPGSTQTLTEAFATSGTFQEFTVLPVPVATVDVGQPAGTDSGVEAPSSPTSPPTDLGQ